MKAYIFDFTYYFKSTRKYVSKFLKYCSLFLQILPKLCCDFFNSLILGFWNFEPHIQNEDQLGYNKNDEDIRSHDEL